VWKNNRNVTFATGVTTALLPPLAPLVEASRADSDHCNTGCDWSYHIKAATADGAQTQMDVRLSQVSLAGMAMSIRYTYWLRNKVVRAVEKHTIPMAVRGQGYAGITLVDEQTRLGTPVKVRPGRFALQNVPGHVLTIGRQGCTVHVVQDWLLRFLLQQKLP
jgi:hypothetical protein